MNSKKKGGKNNNNQIVVIIILIKIIQIHKSTTNIQIHHFKTTFFVQGPLQECHSIRSGFCGPTYYCALLVCVPAVIGVLAVWPYYKPKTKNCCNQKNHYGVGSEKFSNNKHFKSKAVSWIEIRKRYSRLCNPGGITETQKLFPEAYFTHNPMYAYLPLFIGSWNMQEHWDSVLFWFGDGRICAVFPPLCVGYKSTWTCHFSNCT